MLGQAVTPRTYARGRGLSRWEEGRGRPFGHRVDRDDVEPDHGLRPHISGLRQLLRPRARQAAEGHGPAQVPQRRRSPHQRPRLRADAPRGHAGHPPHVAFTAARVRQLDERPLPPGRAARFHPPRVRRDGRHATAHVPDPHQALPSAAESRRGTGLAGQRLDGRQRRDRALRLPHRPPLPSRRQGPFCQCRAATGTTPRSRPHRHRLADRRRRERSRGAPDGEDVGPRPPGPVRSRWRRVLLQAMGRPNPKSQRPRPRWETPRRADWEMPL